MKTLITIDFDWFVPEFPELDFGHAESLLFLDMIWQGRLRYFDKVQTTGREKTFWRWLAGRVDLSHALYFVSDSHLFAHALALRADRVIMFDEHHDCWPADSLGVDKKCRSVYCHNWLRAALERGKRRQAIWVRPPERYTEFPLPDDMNKRVQMLDFDENMDLCVKDATFVHVCRSGCWVPPWLDRAFLAFLRASGRPLDRFHNFQDNKWSPLKERWSEKEFKAIQEREAEIQEKMKEMAVGQISSSDFLNCKVEVKK